MIHLSPFVDQSSHTWSKRSYLVQPNKCFSRQASAALASVSVYHIERAALFHGSSVDRVSRPSADLGQNECSNLHIDHNGNTAV